MPFQCPLLGLPRIKATQSKYDFAQFWSYKVEKWSTAGFEGVWSVSVLSYVEEWSDPSKDPFTAYAPYRPIIERKCTFSIIK
jgi:hypothetical protein